MKKDAMETLSFYYGQKKSSKVIVPAKDLSAASVIFLVTFRKLKGQISYSSFNHLKNQHFSSFSLT